MQIESMPRDARCPICGSDTEQLLKLRFGRKYDLPTEPVIRFCSPDNFAFVATGSQSAYDQYYSAVANDTVHQEIGIGGGRSPIALLQKENLLKAIKGFFENGRKVFDFGCGAASLLLELATEFPNSTFVGHEISPAAGSAIKKALSAGLQNISIISSTAGVKERTYDLVIVSHVLEHLIDLGLLNFLKTLLTHDGLLYIEVPNSLQYRAYSRREFMYYFDRLHVNHFTPQALVNLLSNCGLGYVGHFEYAFPYRDGTTEYPALGVLFRQETPATDVQSPNLLEEMKSYLAHEKVRAKEMAATFSTFDGILVWGCGDNFHRATENGGPLSQIKNWILLDRKTQDVVVGGKTYTTVNPETAIRSSPWPIVVTVSEASREIGQQIAKIDPYRKVFYV